MRPTVRLKMTLLYAGVFFVAGALLLSVSYALVRNNLTNPSNLRNLPADNWSYNVAAQHEIAQDALARLRTQYAIALAAMTGLSVVLGWAVAGRVLRPLQRITATAKRVSQDNLDERIGLEGPRDELKELADTFDDMLDRLHQSFVAQRRFSAQVSHELRTPLSVIRNETELLLADGAHDRADTAAIEHIRAATLRAERLIAALLALSKTESGNLERASVALDELVGEVVADVVRNPQWRDRRFDLDLEPATVLGDRALLVALTTNLVDNAARHNRKLGWVNVAVRETDGETRASVLTVTNSRGPDVAPSSGVGMTVVQAIVEAHGGTLAHEDPADDTFAVRVTLPAVPAELFRPQPLSSTR
jgi:signal transduction histidine kinase